MARMIPSSGPREFDPRSREGLVYSALSQLDDTYTVVHSMSLVSVARDIVQENEADFVVFSKDKGVICFEVKAGQVSYQGGEWLYSNGKAMSHGGPFRQSDNIKFRLMEMMQKRGMSDLVNRCRFINAVWFPSISSEDMSRFDSLTETVKERILCSKDLENPEAGINRIYATESGRTQDLNEREEQLILERFLCPEFKIVPTSRAKYDFNNAAFSRLLNSQIHILDFLDEQQFAVINGVAGSGKTLIAVEQAKRKAETGNKVLFLCYNTLLCEDLRRRCSEFSNIEVYTIDAFATKLCGSNDYELLQEVLLDKGSAVFPYQHLIIDEGQDFGTHGYGDTPVNRSDLLEMFKYLIEQVPDGSFFMFYDKYQLIQGTGLPDFVNEAECRLTLKENCRNTSNIAKSCFGGLAIDKPFKPSGVTPNGDLPKFFNSDIVDEQIQYVNQCIAQLKRDGIKDIVVLTCRSLETTIFASMLTTKQEQVFWRDGNVPFYTCRKFKGLEADAVILVDVTSDIWVVDDKSPFSAKPGYLFYTGASRAKHELRIVCDMDDDEFEDVNDAIGINARRNPRKSFLRQINACLDKDVR